MLHFAAAYADQAAMRVTSESSTASAIESARSRPSPWLAVRDVGGMLGDLLADLRRCQSLGHRRQRRSGVPPRHHPVRRTWQSYSVPEVPAEPVFQEAEGTAVQDEVMAVVAGLVPLLSPCPNPWMSVSRK